MNSKVFALLLIAAVGVLADEYNCAAEGKVCQNGGICHDTIALASDNPGSGGNGWATPTCICKAPYGGVDCSYTIRECKDSPCRNGGSCHPSTCRPGATMNQYDCFTCECAPGWTGAPAYTSGSDNTGGICDWPLPVNDCSVNTCYNGGVCTNVHSPTVSSYSCDCTAHWGGANCTVPLFNCTTTHPCQNGGTCNGIGTSCTCVTGYTGNVCQNHFCDSNPCMNGGTCFNGNPGSARCQCTNQWTDPFCGTPRFCESNPCQNSGTCTNNAFPSTTGSCTCLANYGGTFCQIAPFCSSSPCQNGATCTNTGAGVGTCTNCPLGYAGTFCEKAIPGCGTPNIDCAVAHTTTYDPNTPNNQQKTCPCRDQASCVSSKWNTACTCKSGPDVYAYDCRCNSTYVPRCPSSFGTVPGQNVDMVCQNGATCVEHADGTYCSCRAGFWGPSCENYDNPCLNNPCNNGGKCSITTETGRRKNPDGAPVLVSFGNIALDDRFWAYQCNCKWPFYGNNCELQAPANPVVCTNNNCQNGGVCGPTSYSTNGWIRKTVGNFAVVGDVYNCACPSNMTGVYCETPKITCANTPNYCMNNGFCVTNSLYGDLANSKPGCICPCGYAGDRCEIAAANADSTQLATLSGPRGGVGYRLDFCSAAPCQNGGTCITTTNGQDFWCVCKSGYANRYCETKVRSSAAGVVPSLFAVAAAVAVAFALKN